jgi:hypothetical protein
MNAASYQGCKDAGAALMKRIDKPNAKIAVLGIPFALQTIRDREKGILDAVGAGGGQIVSLQSDFSQDKLLALPPTPSRPTRTSAASSPPGPSR